MWPSYMHNLWWVGRVTQLEHVERANVSSPMPAGPKGNMAAWIPHVLGAAELRPATFSPVTDVARHGTTAHCLRTTGRRVDSSWTVDI